MVRMVNRTSIAMIFMVASAFTLGCTSGSSGVTSTDEGFIGFWSGSTLVTTTSETGATAQYDVKMNIFNMETGSSTVSYEMFTHGSPSGILIPVSESWKRINETPTEIYYSYTIDAGSKSLINGAETTLAIYDKNSRVLTLPSTCFNIDNQPFSIILHEA